MLEEQQGCFSFDKLRFLTRRRRSFFIGIDILRGVKMWESEGFVNVGSISRFCECDLL